LSVIHVFIRALPLCRSQALLLGRPLRVYLRDSNQKRESQYSTQLFIDVNMWINLKSQRHVLPNHHPGWYESCTTANHKNNAPGKEME
jgi:hypothetical protein